MKEQLEKLRQAALEAVQQSEDLQTLENARVRFLGKKGEITSILKQMGGLSPEERPIMGQLANSVRQAVEESIAAAAENLKKKQQEMKLKAETIDVTLPGEKQPEGHRHPLEIVLNEVKDIFIGMGFQIADGPEVEWDYYNFEALNIPEGHPARDTQDTFYITEKMLLRTQTSPVQIRYMEKHKPPIRMIAPGRVFRSDPVDATHSPLFHQIEGLVVDKKVTLCDLKGALETFAQKIFGEGTTTRLRPSYFPFTEPSVEVDCSCFACGGKGCNLCKGTGWFEVLGAGVVNKKVLENCGIDSEEYSGFAFGIGIERATMLKYGINNIKLLYESDLDVLKQIDHYE